MHVLNSNACAYLCACAEELCRQGTPGMILTHTTHAHNNTQYHTTHATQNNMNMRAVKLEVAANTGGVQLATHGHTQKAHTHTH